MLPFFSPLYERHQLPELGYVPKYGSLTLGEHLLLEQILDASFRELLSSPLGAIAITAPLQELLTLTLITSRIEPSWKLGEVKQLEPITKRAAAEFLLSERSRWGQLLAASTSTVVEHHQSAIDWGAIFWRLAAAYPGDQRFSEERFSALPLVVIEGAIAALDQRELHQAHAAALPIALAASVMARPHYKKMPELDWFDPYGLALRKQAIRQKLSKENARLFLELSKAGEIGSWVMQYESEVSAIRLCAED